MLIFAKEDLLFKMLILKQTKLVRSLIMLLLLINGLGALSAGYGFIKEPNGSLVGIDRSVLLHSPFNDFLIPGIILFIFNGLYSIFVLWQVAKKTPIAGYSLLTQGLISCGWIIIQVMMLRTLNILHFVFGVIGIVFLFYGYQYIKQKLR